MFTWAKRAWKEGRLFQKLFLWGGLDARITAIKSSTLNKFFVLLMSECRATLKTLILNDQGFSQYLPKGSIFYRNFELIDEEGYLRGYKVMACLFLKIFFEKNDFSELGKDFKDKIMLTLTSLLGFSEEEKQNLIFGIVNTEWYHLNWGFLAYRYLAEALLGKEKIEKFSLKVDLTNAIDAVIIHEFISKHYNDLLSKIPDDFFINYNQELTKLRE